MKNLAARRATADIAGETAVDKCAGRAARRYSMQQHHATIPWHITTTGKAVGAQLIGLKRKAEKSEAANKVLKKARYVCVYL